MGYKEYLSPFPDVKLVDMDLLKYLFSNPNNCPPDKPIYCDAVTGECRTYADILHRTKCLVTGLRELGVREGDVVALFSPNTIDYAIQCYAILGAGAIVSPANYASTANELHNQLQTAVATFLIAHSSLLEVAGQAVQGTSVRKLIQANGQNNKQATIEQLVSKSEPGHLFAIPPHEAETRLAFLCFSSGTTGVSKGVMTSHKNMTSNVQQWLQVSPDNWSGKSTFVGFLPFSHIYGLNYFLCTSMISGSTVAVIARFELDLYLRTVEKYKANVLVLVPPVVLLLVKDERVTSYNLKHVKRLLSAAAPLSVELRIAVEARFRALGVEIDCFQAWGLTETSPFATIVPEERIDKKESVGCVAPNMRMRLVDPETLQDVEETDRPGEIWCKGPNVARGYYRNEQATRDGFAQSGWFRTGDIGTVDADGYFQILDRIKEMIKYKGLQVIPSELEGKLLEHPFVDDAGVIGVFMEEQATEVPLAFVVLSPAAKPAGQATVVENIHEWLNARVANHKRLRGGIHIVKWIPKSPSGKLLRRELREMVKTSRLVSKL